MKAGKKGSGEVYNPPTIEKKWQQVWAENGVYEPDLTQAPRPYYNLMMFPYPSAEGLHVGNMYAFTGSDIYGRFKRMQGYQVFEPIGLDGFGIHSENYAMKIGEHPVSLSKKTEENFYRQLHLTGNGYSWKNKLETYDPAYYSWTQWIFIQLFKAGLAYRGEGEVNWCPSCLTVLADEQVINKQETINNKQSFSANKLETKQVCERCGSEVAKKKLTQWYFKITDYAQKLLDGLDVIDWSAKVKIAQRNWIGKSEGAEVVFPIVIDKSYSIRIFTTRVDTIFGVTFLALAVDHELVTAILGNAKGPERQAIREFLYKKGSGSRVEGLEGSKEGVFTGFWAVNPINHEKVPVYIVDYVLTGYGTGAVMGVPAHDQRDWDFAKKYDVPIREVIKPGKDDDVSRAAFTNHGELINSGKYNGLRFEEAVSQIIADFEKGGKGKSAVNWHLRDWIISRQRYWGPPIPMIFCEKCAKDGKSWFTIQNTQKTQKARESDKPENLKIRKAEYSESSGKSGWSSDGWYPVPEEDLPVLLPYVEKFKPTGSGQAPLAQDKDFVNVKCPGCGSPARRETDVSDTFLDSAWYFLRYPSVSQKNPKSEIQNPKQTINSKVQNNKSRAKSQALGMSLESKKPGFGSAGAPWDLEITRRWLPVDMYIGGAEHSVLHLLYSRFLWKVFYDLGYFDFSAKSLKGRLGGLAKMPDSGWEEPFTKFRAHGLLIKGGAKMSKSKGNVVNPDDYIAKFGADTLRAYLMFCGRFSEGGDFRDEGIEGMHRFLKRVWKLAQENLKFKIENLKLDKQSLFMMHKTVKKVTEDIENLSYNTAIAALMEWMNFLEGKQETGNKKQETRKSVYGLKFLVSSLEVETLLKLLAPFAPYMTEELFQKFLGNSKSEARNPKQTRISNDKNPKFRSIHLEKWPEYDAKLATSEKITLVVQVNGKLRERIEVERGVSKEDAEKLALNSENVSKYISSSTNYKVIYVADRLINLVTTSGKN